MRTEISFKLSQALTRGRAVSNPPNSREAVLARLLAKRAAAHRAGLGELERILRAQIKWALPMRTPDGKASEIRRQD